MRIVKQLSIFLENKPGVLARLCDEFAAQGLNITGMSISDTVDHAVVRLIISDPLKARTMLESTSVLVVENDVLLLQLADHPGALAKVAHKLAKAKINIEYAYGTTHTTAHSVGANLVVRVSDTRKALALLKKK
jgi:hypothetical protein